MKVYIIKSEGANNRKRVIAIVSKPKNMPETSETKVIGKKLPLH